MVWLLSKYQIVSNIFQAKQHHATLCRLHMQCIQAVRISKVQCRPKLTKCNKEPSTVGIGVIVVPQVTHHATCPLLFIKLNTATVGVQGVRLLPSHLNKTHTSVHHWLQRLDPAIDGIGFAGEG